MHILVIGYYYHNNLGDESYRDVLGKFFPGDYLEFVDADKIKHIDGQKYDAIIVGGGDIINDYFVSKIKPYLKTFIGTKIAFSIGFPFPNLITEEYIGYFDHVFTRNLEDLRRAQKILGSHRAHYLPDATFKLSLKEVCNSGDKTVRTKMEQKQCGMFLVGNLIRYDEVVEDLTRLVVKLSKRYQVTLYCFDSREDYRLSQRVVDHAREKAAKLGYYSERTVNEQIQLDMKQYTTYEMLDVINKLDYAVCMKYHAHIFAMICGVPFLSISSTRKTRLLMKQANVKPFQYEIPLDAYSTPIKIEYNELKKVYNYSEKHKAMFIDRTGKFVEHARFMLDTQQPHRILHNLKENINEKVIQFIQSTKDYMNGARMISSHVLGYPDSPYVWGMSEKLSSADENNKSLNDVIDSSKKYLIKIVTNEKVRDSCHLIPDKLPINIDLSQYSSYKDAHRGGWYLAIEKLHKMSTKNGIILDMYVDRTFHWARNYMMFEGLVPYTSPWAGFIHHTIDTTYSQNNTTLLFENKEFLQSLDTCIALFTLSETLSKFLRDKLSKIARHVRVVTFTHPILLSCEKFSMPRFENNPDPMLVNIGAWLRNPFAIYLVDSKFLKKAVLVGKHMDGYIPPDSIDIKPDSERPGRLSLTFNTKDIVLEPCRPEDLSKWIAYYAKYLDIQGVTVTSYDSNTVYVANNTNIPKLKAQLSELLTDVKIIRRLDNEDYDKLLSQNIVFLNLIDAAAVNTIIECIVRSTPIVVNRLPGVIDLLGPNYPLLYNDIQEIPSLLSYENILRAHRYLRNLDISTYHIDYFIETISDVVQDY